MGQRFGFWVLKVPVLGSEIGLWRRGQGNQDSGVKVLDNCQVANTEVLGLNVYFVLCVLWL